MAIAKKTSKAAKRSQNTVASSTSIWHSHQSSKIAVCEQNF
ncbi:hypothetical protein [Calothrix sp. NIES-2100]